jgi:hypothetical protein
MLSNYPNYIHTVNLAYDMTVDLYQGFLPLNGDKQIFAPLVLENLCGGPGNPLNTSPCCYMNCGDGSPQYGVVIHEMGHNFQEATGMSQFLYADNNRFDDGAGECTASFPFIYFAHEISQNGEQYGLGPETFEWSFMNDIVRVDTVDARRIDLLEELIAAGESTGFFDNPGLFDSVGVFCAFFQSYIHGYDGHSTPYGHNMIRRFMAIFGRDGIPDFQEEKVETYFAAAFSISAGSDERQQLRQWGFTIDDAFYELIEPILAAKLIRKSPLQIARESAAEHINNAMSQNLMACVYPSCGLAVTSENEAGQGGTEATSPIEREATPVDSLGLLGQVLLLISLLGMGLVAVKRA